VSTQQKIQGDNGRVFSFWCILGSTVAVQ